MMLKKSTGKSFVSLGKAQFKVRVKVWRCKAQLHHFSYPLLPLSKLQWFHSMRNAEYEVIAVNGIKLKNSKYFVTLGKGQFKVTVKIEHEKHIYKICSVRSGTHQSVTDKRTTRKHNVSQSVTAQEIKTDILLIWASINLFWIFNLYCCEFSTQSLNFSFDMPIVFEMIIVDA